MFFAGQSVPAAALEFDGYDIVLIAGQSNTAYGYPASVLDVANSDTDEFTRSSVIQQANDPLDTWGGPITDTGVALIGPVMQFCRAYIADGQLLPNRKLLVVHCGLGGSGFMGGSGGWGDFAGSLQYLTVNRVADAVATDAGNAVVAMIWIQGEADSATGGSWVTDYQAHLLTLFAAFRTIPTASASPIIVGSMTGWTIGTYPGAVTVNAIHASIASLIANSIYVNNTDLGIANIHFNSTEQRTIGDRMFAAWSTL